MFLTFTVQYFDKTLLSYASVMGIIQETNLTSSEYAWYDLHLNLTEDPRCADEVVLQVRLYLLLRISSLCLSS